MESQRNYAIVASKITDRFAFANAVQDVAIKNGIRHELSFTGDRALRGEIMNAIVEYVDSVNYVYAHRPVGYEFEINPKMIHKQLLSSLTGMLDFEKGEDVLIFVDSNDDLISDETVKQILNPDGNRNIVCLVLPSRYFYELQGHDIITGAIGMELNSSDSQYSDILREHDRRITGKKVDFKLRRRQ